MLVGQADQAHLVINYACIFSSYQYSFVLSSVDLDVASTLANLSSLIGQQAGFVSAFFLMFKNSANEKWGAVVMKSCSVFSQPILTTCPVPGDQMQTVRTGISNPSSEGRFADIGVN